MPSLRPDRLIRRYLPLVLIGSSLALSGPSPSFGADPAPDLKLADPAKQTAQSLTQRLDDAANRQDSDGMMQLYGSAFASNDGLTRQMVEQSVKQLWKQYPKLLYRTEILTAKALADGIEAETLTNVTGSRNSEGREFRVEFFVRSRQRWQGEQLIQQEILSEQTRLSLGQNPPAVSVNLPETVKVGERFNYEAIVDEPLGTDILMGEILDQPVTTAYYTNPPKLLLDMPSVLELVGDRSFPMPNRRKNPQETRVKLKRLRAGGFFKSVSASKKTENRWLSAVLVRHDAGVTIVTQRLRIVP
jgi:hypothetical protein